MFFNMNVWIPYEWADGLGDYLTSFGVPRVGVLQRRKSLMLRISFFVSVFVLKQALHLPETKNRAFARLCLLWRWGGDSNPRNPYEFGSLANCWFQPLTHLTKTLRFIAGSAKIQILFNLQITYCALQLFLICDKYWISDSKSDACENGVSKGKHWLQKMEGTQRSWGEFSVLTPFSQKWFYFCGLAIFSRISVSACMLRNL